MNFNNFNHFNEIQDQLRRIMQSDEFKNMTDQLHNFMNSDEFRRQSEEVHKMFTGVFNQVPKPPFGDMPFGFEQGKTESKEQKTHSYGNSHVFTKSFDELTEEEIDAQIDYLNSLKQKVKYHQEEDLKREQEILAEKRKKLNEAIEQVKVAIQEKKEELTVSLDDKDKSDTIYQEMIDLNAKLKKYEEKLASLDK